MFDPGTAQTAAQTWPGSAGVLAADVREWWLELKPPLRQVTSLASSLAYACWRQLSGQLVLAPVADS